MIFLVDAMCKKMLEDYMGLHASLYCPLPDSTIVTMLCMKSIETVHGKPTSDVSATQDCTVFFDYPISIPMSKVPTKRFTFKCTRLVEDRRPRQNPLLAMMVRRNVETAHLLPPRERGFMTGRDVFYNDLRKYLEDKGVGFEVDASASLGDEFIKHLTYALFPLSQKVWISINEKNNRGEAAPNSELGVFFGRKILGHKSDKPDMALTVQHLQDLWIGMGDILAKCNWTSVSLPIKHLSILFQKYAQRTSSQAERQLSLINKERPARNVETVLRKKFTVLRKKLFCAGGA
jgi:hypothetical protein